MFADIVILTVAVVASYVAGVLFSAKTKAAIAKVLGGGTPPTV